MDPAGGACPGCRKDQMSTTCCRGAFLRRSTRTRRRVNGADHISALPDDLLLQILARLRCARAAAHTGLLSRRWRGLWTRLPELDFHSIPPDRLRAALDQVARPAGSLRISIPGHHPLSRAGMFSMLQAVALLAPAKIDFEILPDLGSGGDAHAVELPDFHRTTSVNVSFFAAPLLLAGEFTALESLSLYYCKTDLGDLLRRCPRLCKLRIFTWLRNSITVHSQSLEELDVGAVVQLRCVDIVAPVLKKLRFNASCGIENEFSFTLSAPLLEDFSWYCPSRSASDRFGVIWRMYYLKLETLESTGHTQLTDSRQNTSSLLQDFPRANVLSLSIRTNNILGDADQSFDQEISRIPVRNFTILKLGIATGGHVYGAMVLDLLRLCTSIEKLTVALEPYKVPKLCSANCSCHQPSNWMSQITSLDDLKEVEIKGFNGEEHEVSLLKVLLRCARMLQRVTVNLSHNVPQNCSANMEFPGILKAHPSVKFSVYHWCGDQVLFN